MPMFPACAASRGVWSAGALLVLAVLSACGGGSSGGSPDDGPTAPTGLQGAVAVGVPITGGKVRILDAAGTEVAKDIAVAADGSFSVPTLSGTPPYRIEACGYAGAQYTCLYSLARGAGVANVTPLTSATVLLAAGQTPETLMSGPGNLSGTAVDTAQQQLRDGLAGVLSGNVPADFNFITGSLDAGSRSGYDKVLDAVGVSTGVDGQPFVQITPRMGSGNLYLQTGSSSGQVTVDTAAAALPLDGLDALFARMSSALASPAACAQADTGMASQMAASARMDMDGQSLSGPAQVGGLLCQFFEMSGLWGSTLMNPTLGRCDTSGAAPICSVGFALKSAGGAVQNVGNGMGVLRDGDRWKFLGSFHPLQFDVSARAQRDRRIDGETPVDHYVRALAIGVPAVQGLRCARARQTNADGAQVLLAWLKRADGDGVKNLSIWRDANGERAADPATGSLRGSDDTWLMLPEGSDGDAVVRNFFRGGRSLSIALFSDTACSTPMQVGGRSEFEVDISGVPPVWSALPGLPWPDLAADTRQVLISFSLAAQASTELSLAWGFPNGRLGLSEMSFCADPSACGDGQPGRIGSGNVSAGGDGAMLSLHNGASALGSYRQLSLHGGSGDGLNLQANFSVCPERPAGQACY